MPSIVGCDIDPDSVSAAIGNVQKAGFIDLIRIQQADFLDAENDTATGLSMQKGLVLFNPPYGKRLDDARTGNLFNDIGRQLKSRYPGWNFGLFIPSDGFAHRLRLNLETALEVSNGGIDCKLVLGTLADAARSIEISAIAAEDNPMFANRLRKNFKTLGRWSRKARIDAYRLYDADMPEYAVAIDVYHSSDPNYTSSETARSSASMHVVIQEYQAPANVDQERAAARLQTVIRDVPEVLDCPAEQVYLKVRKRQRGLQQYERESAGGKERVIHENGARLRVNLQDYLDTGLFLDHRKVRKYIQHNSQGKRFLNLFAYTGTSTVHAAIGGARTSLTAVSYTHLTLPTKA